MPQIIPIKELKNTSEISDMCHKTDEPIYITKNGYGDMVIMSMESYEASLEKIKPGQTVLRNLIDYHLCDFAVRKYPERIKGEVAIKFTHYLKNLQDKSIKKMFSHTQKWILRFLTMKNI